MASPGIFPKQLKSKPRPHCLAPCRENGQNQMHISIIEITVPRTYTVRVCVSVCGSIVFGRSGSGTRYAYTHYQAHNKRLPLPRALFIYLKTPPGRSSIMLQAKGKKGEVG